MLTGEKKNCIAQVAHNVTLYGATGGRIIVPCCGHTARVTSEEEEVSRVIVKDKGVEIEMPVVTRTNYQLRGLMEEEKDTVIIVSYRVAEFLALMGMGRKDILCKARPVFDVKKVVTGAKALETLFPELWK